MKRSLRRKALPDRKIAESELRKMFDQAVALHRQGNIDHAENLYRDIIVQNPSHEGALNLLGVITMQKGNWGAAMDHIKKAIEVRPDYAEAYCNMGVLMRDIGNLDEAEKNIRKAIELKPGYDRAHFNLGTVLYVKGCFVEALDNFELTVKYSPLFMEAWEKLSEIKNFHGDNELVPLMEKAITSQLSDMKPMTALIFQYILGKVNEDIGKFESAFMNYEKANKLERIVSREFHPVDFYRKYAEAMIDIFDEDFFARRKEWGCSSQSPVFVIGMPKSGIEEVERILFKSSGAVVFSDDYTGSIIKKAFNKENKPLEQALKDIDKPFVSKAVEKFLKHFSRGSGGETKEGLRLADLSRMNFLNFWLAALMFPNSKVIYCNRTPADICLDCYFSHSHPLRKYSLEELALFYRDVYAPLAGLWKTSTGLGFIEVDYADISLRPVEMARKIAAFCGMDSESIPDDFDFMAPCYDESVDKYKNYTAKISKMLEILS